MLVIVSSGLLVQVGRGDDEPGRTYESAKHSQNLRSHLP